MSDVNCGPVAPQTEFVEQVPAARRTWRTPTVIQSAMTDTQNGPGYNPDTGSGGS